MLFSRSTELKATCSRDALTIGKRTSTFFSRAFTCKSTGPFWNSASLLKPALSQPHCVFTGLHAFRLDIQRITVDGQDASFELRPYPEENLPENVLEGMNILLTVAAGPAVTAQIHILGLCCQACGVCNLPCRCLGAAFMESQHTIL